VPRCFFNSVVSTWVYNLTNSLYFILIYTLLFRLLLIGHQIHALQLTTKISYWLSRKSSSHHPYSSVGNVIILCNFNSISFITCCKYASKYSTYIWKKSVASYIRHYYSYCIMIRNIQINYTALFEFYNVVTDYFWSMVFKYFKCDKFRFININFKNHVLHKLVN